MASMAVTKVYHISTFIWYFAIVYLLLIIPIEHPPAGVFLYAGQWKYLTFLNLFLQTIFNGICILADFLGHVMWIRALRDIIFSALAFPVGTFVVTSFWLLFSYDRALVYPEGLDKLIPLWLNHAMHSIVLPVILLELILTPHRYPKRRTGFLILGFISLFYLLWILWIYSATGKWVYPFLGLFSPLHLMSFISASVVLVNLLYLLGEKLTLLIWGTVEKAKQRKRK
ncbi:androgen-dependent TFPI-regulating protein [Callorhinchus milii]|nr:androgen-dependent TFPI-regulating protein [Callorhinchus milii]|eukprot:gi/632976042/ref/XP_007904571.1/ PREDICTED: androgen-dependent TFPI-regulating protein-like [Callorhinchus milii]